MKALFSMVDGLSNNDPVSQWRLSIDAEQLLLEERTVKLIRPTTDRTYRIPLKNVIEIIATTEKEFVEQNKSAIGRGVAGGLLFGPAGLVLGGLSGVGTKNKIKTSRLLIVSYLTSDGEIANLILNTHKVSNIALTDKFQRFANKELGKVTPVNKVAELRKSETDNFIGDDITL